MNGQSGGWSEEFRKKNMTILRGAERRCTIHTFIHNCIYIDTGWWLTYPSEKYEFVNGVRTISYIMENKKCSKPPTSIYILYADLHPNVCFMVPFCVQPLLFQTARHDCRAATPQAPKTRQVNTPCRSWAKQTPGCPGETGTTGTFQLKTTLRT